MNVSAQSDEAAFDSKDPLLVAQQQFKRSRAEGLAALNQLFRSGKPPDPQLDGPYLGELVALTIAPGVSQFLQWVASMWMPWKGKFLALAAQRGENIFDRGSRLVFRLLFPFYKRVAAGDERSFRAFAFNTWIGAGKEDPDLQVLKIDYDMPENPALTIRPIVDELVQVGEGLYLGKIHFKWWLLGWRMVGYFALRKPAT